MLWNGLDRPFAWLIVSQLIVTSGTQWIGIDARARLLGLGPRSILSDCLVLRCFRPAKSQCNMYAFTFVRVRELSVEIRSDESLGLNE